MSPAIPIATSPDWHLSGTRHPHVLALVMLRGPLGLPNCQTKHPQSRNPSRQLSQQLWFCEIWSLHPKWKLLRAVRIRYLLVWFFVHLFANFITDGLVWFCCWAVSLDHHFKLNLFCPTKHAKLHREPRPQSSRSHSVGRWNEPRPKHSMPRKRRLWRPNVSNRLPLEVQKGFHACQGLSNFSVSLNLKSLKSSNILDVYNLLIKLCGNRMKKNMNLEVNPHTFEWHWYLDESLKYQQKHIVKLGWLQLLPVLFCGSSWQYFNFPTILQPTTNGCLSSFQFNLLIGSRGDSKTIAVSQTHAMRHNIGVWGK